MRIKKIRLSGFNRLYEGYISSYKESRTSYTSGLFNFLNNNMVSIELTGITTMELFYLKEIASDVKIINKEYGNFVKSSEEEALQKVNCLLEIHDEMLKDDDIDKSKNYIDNILPIGCELYHVIAIFKGSKITSITGALIEDIFKDENKLFDVYPGDFIIENKIAEKFYNSFYTFMSSQVTDIDVTTEFMNNKKFYQYADDICNLSHVNTPYGEIVFFGNSQDVLTKQIQNVVDSMQTTPYVFSDKIYFTFVMKTTFSTFMKFFLNTNYVIDHENFKLVFLKENVELDDDMISKYNARLSNSIDFLGSYKKGLSESTVVDLNKFNFIYNGTEICYLVQIPYSEIDEIVKLIGVTFNEIIPALDKIESITTSVAKFIGVI